MGYYWDCELFCYKDFEISELILWQLCLNVSVKKFSRYGVYFVLSKKEHCSQCLRSQRLIIFNWHGNFISLTAYCKVNSLSVMTDDLRDVKAKHHYCPLVVDCSTGHLSLHLFSKFRFRTLCYYSDNIVISTSSRQQRL